MNLRIILFLATCLVSLATTAQHTLTLTITDIRSERGTIHIAVYKGADTWLKAEKVFRTLSIPAKEGSQTLTLKDLPAGEYGLAMLHDKDGDEELSYTWIGMPAEAYGFSRIDSRIMREPTFEECKVSIQRSQALTIDLVHWL